MLSFFDLLSDWAESLSMNACAVIIAFVVVCFMANSYFVHIEPEKNLWSWLEIFFLSFVPFWISFVALSKGLDNLKKQGIDTDSVTEIIMSFLVATGCFSLGILMFLTSLSQMLRWMLI